MPTVDSITPNTVAMGSGDFTITITGSNFASDAVVRWDGSDTTTTFVSATELKATISAADVTTLGAVAITVFNPAPGGGESTALTLNVDNPMPATTGLTPDTVDVGGGDFTLAIAGTGFSASSVVRYNGADRATTFDPANPTQLDATITAGDIAATGTGSVSVFNPTPGGGESAALSLTISNPAPVLNNLAPSGAQAGGPTFTLLINGSGFNADSIVRWNGADRGTNLISSVTLEATIPATDITAVGTAEITVFNPLPGGGTSAPSTFVISALPVPTITSLAPNNTLAGGAQFTLTVNGSGFVNGATQVQWNSAPRTTTFVNSNMVRATITDTDIALADTAIVTVQTTGVGGGTSNPRTFTINNPAPSTSSIAPNVVQVGGAEFQLGVTGAGFNSMSVVRFNGSPRATTLLSPTQLRATILATDISVAGNATITVFNPTPGGGTSGGATLVISALPVPTTTAISPSSANAGDPGFTLIVTGTNFISGQSFVQWNGVNRVTNFVSETQLTTDISMSDIAAAGTVDVTINTTGQGGGVSNPQTFLINNPLPTITSLNPVNTLAGGVDFVLQINGTGFNASSVARWNGEVRIPVLQTATELRINITAADIAVGNVIQVGVENSAPGGGMAQQAFTINNPTPTIAGFTPASVTAGGAGFALAVNGSGFNADTVVQWNGMNRTPTSVTASSITFNVTAGDIAVGAIATVTVINPTPGGGTAQQAFTINNPSPAINGFNPATATAGDAPFTLTVNGSGFNADSVVTWNGVMRTPGNLTANSFTLPVSAADLMVGANITIAVTNPAPGGGNAQQTFVINNPSVTIANLNPPSTVAGGPAFQMTINGTGFNADSMVTWGGNARTPVTLTPTAITIDVSAADIAVGDTLQVSVANPAPGGGNASSTFTITNPIPNIASFTPPNIEAGGGGFPLTVNGTGFNADSEVRWNGDLRTPTGVTATAITFSVPANDYAVGQIAAISVTNPGPGGGVDTLNFTINNPNPSISGFNPANVTAGGSTFPLTVMGTGFNADSSVQWGGAARAIIGRTPTTLTFNVPDTDIQLGDIVDVTVTNPVPGGGNATLAFTINNPNPSITGFNPATATAGGPTFELTVLGTGFNADSIVQWDGNARTPNSITTTAIAFDVTAAEIAQGATVPVTVMNPVPGGGTATVNFAVDNPLPVVSGLIPFSVIAGTPGNFPLTVNGSGFNTDSVVRWGGVDRATTFDSVTSLSIQVLEAEVATPGTVDVTVFNPTPGGGVSNPRTFVINTAGPPIITSLVPNTVVQNSGAFTLLVNGSGFDATSIVLWNGGDRTTIFDPATPLELDALINDFDVDDGACIPVAVYTPALGLSNTVAFTVDDGNGLCGATQVPVLNDVLPRSVAAGSGLTTINVIGSAFTNASVVNVNGVSASATRFVSATQLDADLQAGDLAAAGVLTIAVFTPGGPGAWSQPEDFFVLGAGDEAFYDNFNRTDGPEGNGWLAKAPTSMDIEHNVMAGDTDFVNLTSYRDGAVFRPNTEAREDTESALEFVRRDPTDDRLPQLHARVTTAATNDDTHEAYLFYVNGGTLGLQGLITAQTGGNLFCTIGGIPLPGLGALTTGERYRIRLQVSGTGADVLNPVSLTGFIEQYVDGAWTLLATDTFTHDPTTVFDPTGQDFFCEEPAPGVYMMPPPISGPASMGFGRNESPTEYYDSYYWRDIP